MDYTIVFVLRSSHEYNAQRLEQTIANVRHFHPRTRIVCLTDTHVKGCENIPFLNDWSGWWGKIELFRPGLFEGPVLYMDIDTRIVNSLDPIVNEWKVHGKQFTMLSNVYKKTDVGSGVMMWEGDYSSLYNTFAENADAFMEEYKTPEKWGDQAFIRDHATWTIRRFNHRCRSYKAECRRGIPAGTHIVYFHGKPRPWEVTGPWNNFIPNISNVAKPCAVCGTSTLNDTNICDPCMKKVPTENRPSLAARRERLMTPRERAAQRRLLHRPS